MLGTITIVILLCPKFRGPKWRMFRILILAATGLSGIAPLVHGIKMFGFEQMMRQSGLPYYLAEGALLVLGALIYAVSPCSAIPIPASLLNYTHLVIIHVDLNCVYMVWWHLWLTMTSDEIPREPQPRHVRSVRLVPPDLPRAGRAGDGRPSGGPPHGFRIQP